METEGDQWRYTQRDKGIKRVRDKWRLDCGDQWRCTPGDEIKTVETMKMVES